MTIPVPSFARLPLASALGRPYRKAMFFANHFVGAYWEDRRQDFPEVVEVVCDVIERLRGSYADVVPSHIWIGSELHEFDPTRAAEQVATSIRARQDEPQDVARFGFYVVLEDPSDGETTGRKVEFFLGAHGELWNAVLPNSYVIHLPGDGPPSEERAVGLVEFLVRMCDPFWSVVATPGYLREQVMSRGGGVRYASWITYLRTARKQFAMPGLRVSPLEKGLLFVLEQYPFESGGSQSAPWQLTDALERCGMLDPASGATGDDFIADAARSLADLGAGLDPTLYARAMARVLRGMGVSCETAVPVAVYFQDALLGSAIVPLVVDGQTAVYFDGKPPSASVLTPSGITRAVRVSTEDGFTTESM